VIVAILETLLPTDYLNGNNEEYNSVNESRKMIRFNKGYNSNFGMEWFCFKLLHGQTALITEK
jgi:hypothetical protein